MLTFNVGFLFHFSNTVFFFTLKRGTTAFIKRSDFSHVSVVGL